MSQGRVLSVLGVLVLSLSGCVSAERRESFADDFVSRWERHPLAVLPTFSDTLQAVATAIRAGEYRDLSMNVTPDSRDNPYADMVDFLGRLSRRYPVEADQAWAVLRARMLQRTESGS